MVNDIIKSTSKSTNNKGTAKKHPSQSSKNGVKTITIVLTIIMVFAIIYLGTGIVNVGAEALKKEYDDTYSAERDEAYQKQYQKYFDKAEREYHVTNRIDISIGNLKEVSNLEILKISDVEYVVEDAKDNAKGITAWLEVPGTGIYVVDLKAAEFIVDDEHSYVKVRVPYPELKDVTIDQKHVEPKLFKNDLLNDSYKDGEELAQHQLMAADLLIKKEFASNQYFYLSAQDAAINTIECLVKQLNPTRSELTVEVEFY